MKIDLIYFNENGKFKYEGVFELPEGRELFEIRDLIRALRKQRRLPGLESGYWDGYIFANGDEAYPFLIFPDELSSRAKRVAEAFSELANTCPYLSWDCEHSKNTSKGECSPGTCPLLLE
jgi:hypothetical protein